MPERVRGGERENRLSVYAYDRSLIRYLTSTSVCDSKFVSSCRNMLKSIPGHQRIKNWPTKSAIITKGCYCIDFDTWLMCTNLPPVDHYELLSLHFLLSRWPIVNGSWGQLLLLPYPSRIGHNHPHICWQADIGSWFVAETNLINFEPDLKSAQRIHQPEVTMRLQLLALATLVIFATMVRSSETVFPNLHENPSFSLL